MGLNNWKKYITTTVLCLVCAAGLHAQGIIGKVFNQKGTQLKRLAEQIAALEVYKGYLKTGYNIAKKGLNTISDFKDGEFGLHKLYFGSLKMVNPEIKRYAKVADIIAMQVKILASQKQLLKKVPEAGVFGEEELEYVRKVMGRLIDACGQTLDELLTLTADGELEMKDDERLQRIDRLYEDMLGHYTFSQSFGKETLDMAGFRKHEVAELGFDRTWQGLDNHTQKQGL